MEKVTIWGRSDNNFVFFGKLVIIALYLSRAIGPLGHIDLPLLPVYAAIPYSKPVYYIWQALFAGFSVFIFLNRKPERFLFLCGTLLILALLVNELSYSNNLVFAACLLIVLSASDSSRNLVPVQLSIVYFGAFIDKLCSDQWRNGDFMTAFFQHSNVFAHLGKILDARWLIMGMTGSSIAIELLLAVLFLIPKARIYAMLMGLFFHFSTVVLMNDFFGFFIIGIMIAYFSLLKTSVNLNHELSFPALREVVKTIARGSTAESPSACRFELNGTTYTKGEALLLRFVWCPFTAVLLAVLFACGNLRIRQAAFFILLFSAGALAVNCKFRRRGEDYAK